MERRAALLHAEEQSLVDAEHRVFFNDLLDLPQPTELRALYDAMDNDARNEGQREAVRSLLARLSSRCPVLILVEDIHWADSIALEHLAGLSAAIDELPALLLMTSRVEGDPIDLTWRSRAGDSPFLTMDLGPLHSNESIELVEALIGRMDDLAVQCIRRAAGNPLFLEQLLHGVQEGTGERVPIRSRAWCSHNSTTCPWPTSTRSVRLPCSASASSAAHCATCSVMKSYECRTLVERHMVRPEGPGYLFSHALIREGVYASLLKEQRRELHRRAAGWFAGHEPILYAEHLECAGDGRAPTAYEEASRLEAREHRFERAITLVDRGLSLCHSDPERYRLCILQGELLRDLGAVEEAIAAFARAKEIALGPSERCRAGIGAAECLRLNEQHERLLQELEFSRACRSRARSC